MTSFTRGKLLTEGKTKRLFETAEDPNSVIVENKSDITAFDDPAYTKQIPAKARYATQTTCRIFEILKASGLPVAFISQLSETEFLVPKVRMIPLEVVARRLAMGSYLDRRPEYRQEGKPYRFKKIVVEFFLKTTKGKVNIDGVETDLHLPHMPAKEGMKILDDPLIPTPSGRYWQLFHPKKNAALDTAANLGLSIDSELLKLTSKDVDEIDAINYNAFLLIEELWAKMGFVLVDWKIEFGRTVTNGEIVIADVIDNDSWRLRDPDFNEVSKQVFRDGGDLNEVEAKYGYVAQMVSKFQLPTGTGK